MSSEAKRWVIKIGSSLVTDEGRGLDRAAIKGWADQIVQLREQGVEVVLVSSGAVAEGMARLGWKERPHALYELQAAAAVGQMGMVEAYEQQFQKHGYHAAQILLTHDDLADRQRYLNARSTLQELLRLGVIPVVNENDTVAQDEMRLGDNDTLGALVANLIEADLLVLLTDQEGLFTANPRLDASAQLIEQAQAEDASLLAIAGDGGKLGRGGMRTKVLAAQRAARSGCATVIASGRQEKGLLRLAQGESLGTRLSSSTAKLAARKQWIASQLVSKGELVLDDGAVKFVRDKGKSLLPVGVIALRGPFNRGDVVSCVNEQGQVFARGLVNYSSEDAQKILGKGSQDLEAALGYIDEPELIHRNNLVLV